MKYILFGAGHDGKILLQLLGSKQVAFFCDNSSDILMEGTVCGVSVLSYEEMKTCFHDYEIVIATRTPRNALAIAKQLCEDKIPFHFMEEVANEIVLKDAEIYQASNKRASLSYDVNNAYFIPLDKVDTAASFDSYFWQDLWAARHIFEEKPNIHYDIGSRVDGFIAHLSSFGQRVCLMDIRPLPVQIPGVEFQQCNATTLETIPNNSIESLSALCSLEHFGLGRYGDPIDPEACFTCFASIQKKMKQGGTVYISVPIGKEHIEFNAHRVFYASTIADSFNDMELLEFSSAYKDDLEHNIDLHKYDNWTEWGGERFGLFRFRKKG